MFLLDDILLAPLNGVIWLGKKIDELVEKELYDPGPIKEQLMELQLRFEMDEIDEKKYMEEEEKLLARLDAIQKRKESEV